MPEFSGTALQIEHHLIIDKKLFILICSIHKSVARDQLGNSQLNEPGWSRKFRFGKLVWLPWYEEGVLACVFGSSIRVLCSQSCILGIQIGHTEVLVELYARHSFSLSVQIKVILFEFDWQSVFPVPGGDCQRLPDFDRRFAGLILTIVLAWINRQFSEKPWSYIGFLVLCVCSAEIMSQPWRFFDLFVWHLDAFRAALTLFLGFLVLLRSFQRLWGTILADFEFHRRSWDTSWLQNSGFSWSFCQTFGCRLSQNIFFEVRFDQELHIIIQKIFVKLVVIYVF